MNMQITLICLLPNVYINQNIILCLTNIMSGKSKLIWKINKVEMMETEIFVERMA